jgi:hypothetical protein
MASTLRRYTAGVTTTAATVVPAVAAARALVVGKVIVASAAGVTFNITAGGVLVAAAVAVPAGGVYSETSLVLLAGDTLTVIATTGSGTISVYGEEVDN